jgi:uncharacterized protein YukJ
MSKLAYSLLKGRVVKAKPFSSNPHQRPHYHLLIEAAGKKYDVAVNIASEPKRVHGGKVVHEDIHVLYAVKAAVPAEKIGPLGDVREGVASLPADSPLRLDYVTDRLVTKDEMHLLPLYNLATSPAHPDAILRLLDRAVKNNHAYAYSFGHRYDQTQPTNAAWHFAPDDGVHNIHMNQGNKRGDHDNENGRHEDGALWIHFQDSNEWGAVYVAFQTQSWDNGPDGYPVDGAR